MNYEYEIQNLKSQVSNLQETVIQMARNNTPIVGKVDESHNKIPQINDNTEGVNDNSLGLFDVASLADENSQAIMELAEMIADM